jgi:pantetheine-phosphate adenylyltransferase
MKAAIYPGSFDPITNGHADIIRRASRIFDRIYIGVAQNPMKKYLFTGAERQEMIRHVFKGNKKIVVESFDGLLSDYVARKKVFIVIRGLRVVTDFDYELSLALMNKNLNRELETVFFMTDEKLLFISSSLIKEVAKFGGNIRDYVPAHVEKALNKKLKLSGSK